MTQQVGLSGNPQTCIREVLGSNYGRDIGPEMGTSSIDRAQLSRFYLKTETESSLRNVTF
jgi:hypothetical protein